MGLGRWTIVHGSHLWCLFRYRLCIQSFKYCFVGGVIRMLLLNLLDDMLFAAIPAVGFALAFNVPPKALMYCAILGASWACRKNVITTLWGARLFLPPFFATCVIGFIGVHLSHRYLAHPNVLHCCGNYSNDSWCSGL